MGLIIERRARRAEAAVAAREKEKNRIRHQHALRDRAFDTSEPVESVARFREHLDGKSQASPAADAVRDYTEFLELTLDLPNPASVMLSDRRDGLGLDFSLHQIRAGSQSARDVLHAITQKREAYPTSEYAVTVAAIKDILIAGIEEEFGPKDSFGIRLPHTYLDDRTQAYVVIHQLKSALQALPIDDEYPAEPTSRMAGWTGPVVPVFDSSIAGTPTSTPFPTRRSGAWTGPR